MHFRRARPACPCCKLQLRSPISHWLDTECGKTATGLVAGPEPQSHDVTYGLPSLQWQAIMWCKLVAVAGVLPVPTCKCMHQHVPLSVLGFSSLLTLMCCDCGVSGFPCAGQRQHHHSHHCCLSHDRHVRSYPEWNGGWQAADRSFRIQSIMALRIRGFL